MTKQNTFYSALGAILVLSACSQRSEPDQKREAELAALAATAETRCFVAVDEGDTAKLQLKTYSNGEVKGSLLIDYAEKGKNDGTIEGKYAGDTLFVDYTFKIGTQNPTVYKNPLALLKRGDSLILGVGQIETHLGRSYLLKEKPIRFDRSKFSFATVACPAPEQ